MCQVALEDLHLKKPFELDNIRDELQDPTSIYSQRLLLSMNPPIDVPLKTQQYCFSGPSSEISFRLIGAIDQLERLAIVIKGSGSLADHGEADEALVIDEYADFIQSLQLYLLKRLMSHNKEGMAVLSSASYPYSRDLAKSISTEEALRLRQRPITPTVISVQDRLIKGNVQRRNRILYARRNANVLVRDQRVQEECLMYERVLPSINLAESKVEEPLLESGTPVLPSATAAIEVDSTFDFSLRPRSPNITVPETAAGATVNFPRPPLRDNNTSESVK